MITKVLDLLIEDEYYGVSHRVETAKGKHKRIRNWKQLVYQIKRSWRKK